MSDKMTFIESGDLGATTYIEDKIKQIKFTNTAEFRQDWSAKKGKYVMELFIDKHHHQITLRVNGKIVFQKTPMEEGA